MSSPQESCSDEQTSSAATTATTTSSSRSYEKLARLYHAISKARVPESRLKQLLELEGDINYQVPEDSCLKLHKPELLGSSALHFAAQQGDAKAAELLIDSGADPALKNRKGLSAVHQLVRSAYKYHFNYRDPFMLQGRLEVPLIDLLLTAHMRQQNTANPRDPCGISHFHVACMANDTEVVEFYVDDSEVSVDEAVDADSPMFPGYTPLHFAARLGCVEVAKILLSHGADLLATDSRGMTALHLAIERNMSVVRYVNLHRHEDDDRSMNREELMAKVKNCESMVTTFLSKIDKAMIDRLDLSPFYVMHTLKDALLVGNCTQYNINECVNFDSAFWPGYTALHFAARFDVVTFKLLLKNGADIEAEDANGDTPFDLCVGTYDVKDIHDIVSSDDTWREILLSDGKTRLVDLVRATRNSFDLRSFIGFKLDINSIFVPDDSPLWPGSTILHLAVLLSRRCIDIQAYDGSLFHGYDDETRPSDAITVCLRFGADVTVQDRHGSTPLHLAFRRLNVNDIYLLLNNHKGFSNPVDRHNVSHLHVACAMEHEYVAKKLIDCGVDVNGAVSPSFRWEPEVQQDLEISERQYFVLCGGATPLHVAITVGNEVIARKLMDAGADVNAKNADGLTPLHLLFRNSRFKKSIGEIFMSPLVTRDCVVNGLSYLHVASFGECPKAEKAVERLLRLGADVNSAIKPWDDRGSRAMESDFHDEMNRSTSKLSFLLDYFAGNTPLHSALDNWRVDIPRSLITHGADVLAKNAAGASPICGILVRDYLLRYYLSVMNEDDEKRLLDEMGVTRLHMACKLCDERMIRDCVERGAADVNARIRDDSRVWPGYTPLHVLVAFYDENEHRKQICRIVRFLLSSGADITIADARGETPLLMNIEDNHIDERPAHIEILMRSLRNTVVNSVSAQGISHLHLACIRNEVSLAARFIKLGADVNQTVDHFADDRPGYAPLHFAACRDCDWFRSDLPPLRTVHLLIERGADVHARDALDNTPLHIAARYVSLFKLPYKRILWAGADAELENFYGMTPPSYLLELTDDETCNNLSYMCLHGCGYPFRKLRLAIRACFNRQTNRSNAK